MPTSIFLTIENRRTLGIRVYVSQLPTGIDLGEVYEVLKFFDIAKEVNKIEKLTLETESSFSQRCLKISHLTYYDRGWHGY